LNKTNLPVLVLKGIALLPNNDIRIEFENDSSKIIIDEAEMLHDNKILVVNEKEPGVLPKLGIIAKVSHKIELPNGKVRVLVTGIKRVQVVEYLNQSKPEEPLESIITDIIIPDISVNDEKHYINKVYKEFETYTKKLPYVSNSALSIIASTKSLNKITDIIVPYLQIDNNRLLDYVYELNPIKRSEMILEDIYHEIEVFEIEKNIDDKIRKELDENQKEYILRQKIKAIKEELGEASIKDNDADTLKEQIKNLKELIELLEDQIKNLKRA